MRKQTFRSIGIAVLIGVVAIAATVGAAEEPNYHGKWQGADSSGQKATVDFGKDGVFTMTVDDTEIYGGNGVAGTARYKFDFTKTPAWLDIIVYDTAGKEMGRLLSIVKFTGPDTMLWRVNSDPTVRPAEFDEKDKENTVQLTRVQ